MSEFECPTAEKLVGFALGTLEEELVEPIVEHLGHCSNCEETMGGLDHLPDKLISQLRTPPQATEILHDPEYLLVVKRLNQIHPNFDLKVEADELLNRIGIYTLVEKLGEGGMGTVYKAVHPKLKREVAIKILQTSSLKKDERIARFEREMEAVGKLSHPNIVQAYDAGEEQGIPFLVMQYINGFDLGEITLEHGPLTIHDSCDVIRQTALGLQHAHEHKLVHRDIKPSNLMLDQNGQVKILDLGLALFHDEPNEVLTSTGQIMGTLDYMAPEQADNTHVVDIRADIYSLGCTFFKLLTGAAPFSKDFRSIAQKIMAHSHSPMPSVQSIRTDVPDDLARVVERMLEKVPEKRFQTPIEVAVALAPFVEAQDLRELVKISKQIINRQVESTTRNYLKSSFTETETEIGSNLMGKSQATEKPSSICNSIQKQFVHQPLEKTMNFDPLHTWLGIPPNEQPPHHYRLLGITVFEPDPTVIENAADRQMTYIRNQGTGQHSAESQQLLNQISTAKLLLLNPSKKQQYDAQLGEQLSNTEWSIPTNVLLAGSGILGILIASLLLFVLFGGTTEPSVEVASTETEAPNEPPVEVFTLETEALNEPPANTNSQNKPHYTLPISKSNSSVGEDVEFDTKVSQEQTSLKTQGLSFNQAPSETIEQSAFVNPIDTVNLLSLIDINKHVVYGQWTKEVNGAFQCKRGMLEVPYDLPEFYDLEASITVLGSHEFFGLGIRVGDHRSFVLLNAGGGNGLHQLDGEHFRKSASYNSMSPLERGKTYKINYQIRPEHIKVLIDGKTAIDWKGDFKRLGIEQVVQKRIESCRPNGIDFKRLLIENGQYSSYAVVSLKLRKVEVRVPANPQVEPTKDNTPALGKESIESISPQNWYVRCWHSPKWTKYPLNKMTTTYKDGIMKVRNTTGIHDLAILMYDPVVLEGDFQLGFEFSGELGYAGLWEEDGVDKTTRFVLPLKSEWCDFSMQRENGRLSGTINGKPARVDGNAPANLIGTFGFTIKKGCQGEFRNFQVNVTSISDRGNTSKNSSEKKLDQLNSVAEIQKKYSQQYESAKSENEKRLVILKLLDEVKDSNSGEEMKAIRVIAKNLAVNLGQADPLFKILTEIEQYHHENMNAERVSYYNQAIKNLPQTEIPTVAQELQTLVTKCLQDGTVNEAVSTAKLIQQLATRTRNRSDVLAAKKILEKTTSALKMSQKYQLALAKSEKADGDFLLIGEYYLQFGSLDDALKAFSSINSPLGHASKLDSQVPSDVESMIACVKAWEQVKDKQTVKLAEERSVFWLSQARAKANTEFENAIVESRLKIYGVKLLPHELRAKVTETRKKYYLIVDHQAAVHDAKLWARNHGGHLATIKNIEDAKDVFRIIGKNRPWVSATKAEGGWIWHDGSPVANLWDTGEPLQNPDHTAAVVSAAREGVGIVLQTREPGEKTATRSIYLVEWDK